MLIHLFQDYILIILYNAFWYPEVCIPRLEGGLENGISTVIYLIYFMAAFPNTLMKPSHETSVPAVSSTQPLVGLTSSLPGKMNCAVWRKGSQFSLWPNRWRGEIMLQSLSWLSFWKHSQTAGFGSSAPQRTKQMSSSEAAGGPALLVADRKLK